LDIHDISKTRRSIRTFKPDQIPEELIEPEELELMAVIALGYPDETPRATKRKDLKDLIVCRD